MKAKLMSKPDEMVNRYSIQVSGIVENANYFNFYPEKILLTILLEVKQVVLLEKQLVKNQKLI